MRPSTPGRGISRSSLSDPGGACATESAQAGIRQVNARAKLRSMVIFASRGFGFFSGLIVDKCQGLKPDDFERLAAADVGAGQLVVAAHHVGLRLGESGAVA